MPFSALQRHPLGRPLFPRRRPSTPNQGENQTPFIPAGPALVVRSRAIPTTRAPRGGALLCAPPGPRGAGARRCWRRRRRHRRVSSILVVLAPVRRRPPRIRWIRSWRRPTSEKPPPGFFAPVQGRTPRYRGRDSPGPPPGTAESSPPRSSCLSSCSAPGWRRPAAPTEAGEAAFLALPTRRSSASRRGRAGERVHPHADLLLPLHAAPRPGTSIARAGARPRRSTSKAAKGNR